MSGLCGIVDFAAPRVDPEALRHMAESSSYRAPGGIAYRFLGQAGLAHQALQARVGKTGLDQPLLDAHHQVCLVMDGRLDNRAELIGQLDPVEGPAISDAGLLLAAYLRWGEACTDHLLGDFAFALWDAARHRLLCAVDALGIKPLHYAHVGSLLCFASDAVQVLLHPAVPDDYNEREIAAYLASRAENPERSFFAAVHKLAPGHRLIAERGVLRVERYWIPCPAEIRYSRDEDYAARFLEILQRAVTDRLRDAGAFAGVAMSGGLDSTSVAALAHRVDPCTRAYTFVFDRLAECDERAYSGAMTEELGLEVEPLEAERLWTLESQVALPHSPDTPFVGWRTCYQEVFRRMAACGSRVLLMGHGGDDLLRGSSQVYAERLWQGDLGAVREVVLHARRRRQSVLRTLYRNFGRPNLPAGVDRLLSSALGKREAPLISLIQPDFVLRTPLGDLRNGLRTRQLFASPARQEVYDALVGIPSYWRLANWHDRHAAAFGIEVRHPFLDRRLFEYVLAIPGKQLFRLDCTKNLLRRSVSGVLPDRIRLRENKTRFTRFLDSILLERASGEIQELLRAPRSSDLGILDGEKLRSTYLGFVHGITDASRRALWLAINLEIWLRRCEAIRHDRRRAPAVGVAA
jgi:asparagine synthase (glutamine-hydrolysing)